MPDKKIWRQFLKVSCGDLMIILCRGRFCWIWYQKVFDSIREAPFWNVFFFHMGNWALPVMGGGWMLLLARMVRGTSIIALLCACDIHAHVHGRASCTRAWCGHGHAYGNDMRMRVAMLRACAWLLTAQVYYWQSCVQDSSIGDLVIHLSTGFWYQPLQITLELLQTKIRTKTLRGI